MTDDSRFDEPTDQNSTETDVRRGPSRRTVIGAAAWTAPVIVVATAAPALAASNETLTRTSPSGPALAADQGTPTQALSVTLLTGATGVPGRNIVFSVSPLTGSTDTSWVSFSPSSLVQTNGSGVASTRLVYGTPKPTSGSTFTVTARDPDDASLTVSWTLTYTTYAPNLAVVRVGDGSAALSSDATRVFLDRFTSAGASGGASLAVPVAAGARLTLSGSASSEGALSLSENRQYLALAGYDAAVGTANVGSSQASRVIGRVAQGFAAVDTSTSVNDLGGNNVRGAVVGPGNQVYVSGQPGVRYTTFGSAGTSTAVTTNNSRAVLIAGGNLFQSIAAAVNQLGSALPTATATPTPVATTTSAYAMVFLDRSTDGSGPNLLYVADDNGGIRKFSRTGTSWTARGVVAGNVRGLTGYVTANGSSVVLYATTTATAANTLVTLVDTAAFNADIAGSTSVIATAPANTVFRGVAFVPTA